MALQIAFSSTCSVALSERNAFLSSTRSWVALREPCRLLACDVALDTWPWRVDIWLFAALNEPWVAVSWLLRFAFVELAALNWLVALLKEPCAAVSWPLRFEIVEFAAFSEFAVSLSWDWVAFSSLLSDDTVEELLLLLEPITLLS